MSESRPPKRKRRCYQFSLRTLLLAFSLSSLLLGWYTVTVRRQKEAVSALRSVGRSVTYRHQMTSTKQGVPWTNWLRDVLGEDFFGTVVKANIGHNDWIADADLRHLERLKSLEWLCLGYSQITDAGLEHLEGLTSLKFLRLSHTHISDAGLEHLEGLTSLQWLKIHSNQITDAGLVHLKGLTSLQRLGLLNTQVTDEGVKKLQQALPNCKISHSNPHSNLRRRSGEPQKNQPLYFEPPQHPDHGRRRQDFLVKHCRSAGFFNNHTAEER